MKNLGVLAVSAAPALVKRLADVDAFVREEAALTLNELGYLPEGTAQKIVQGFGIVNSPNQSHEFSSASQRAKEYVNSVVKLRESLEGVFADQYALALLAKAEPLPVASIPDLIRALKNKNARVRSVAARTLGDFGSQSRSAIPALTDATKDTDADVARDCEIAIVKIQMGGAGAAQSKD